LHFSRFAGQKTEKTHFHQFLEKYFSSDHNFAFQMSLKPFYLISEKNPHPWIFIFDPRAKKYEKIFVKKSYVQFSQNLMYGFA